MAEKVFWRSNLPAGTVEVHRREPWVDGKPQRCEVHVEGRSTYLYGGPWLHYITPCLEHAPLTGKFYEKPQVKPTDCGECECCTDHERENRMRVEFFRLGDEYGRRND